MDIIKGKSANSRTQSACKRSFFIALAASLPMLLSACVHWPDIAYECEAYGVVENNQPMGALLEIKPLYRDELEAKCADVKHAMAQINPDAKVSGCVVDREDGAVEAYYWVGDRCAMNHELCHVMHGADHTERYDRELASGVPMPYCPQNQFKR